MGRAAAKETAKGTKVNDRLCPASQHSCTFSSFLSRVSLRFFYVIRIMPDVWVEVDHYRGNLREYSVKQGVRLVLKHLDCPSNWCTTQRSSECSVLTISRRTLDKI